MISSRLCKVCSEEYTPKPGGYNSLYCSKKCKVQVRVRPTKEQRIKYRLTSYQKIKLDKDRHGKHLEQNRSSKDKVRDWLAFYKSSRGCTDCGYNLHWSALQLDHEGPKTANISDLRSSVARLQDEINNGKCTVRCANCHAVKTWHKRIISKTGEPIWAYQMLQIQRKTFRQ